MSEQERIDKLEKKLAEWELIFTAWALFVLLAGDSRTPHLRDLVIKSWLYKMALFKNSPKMPTF